MAFPASGGPTISRLFQPDHKFSPQHCTGGAKSIFEILGYCFIIFSVLTKSLDRTVMKYKPFSNGERSIWWVGPSILSLYNSWPFSEVISMKCWPGWLVSTLIDHWLDWGNSQKYRSLLVKSFPFHFAPGIALQ